MYGAYSIPSSLVRDNVLESSFVHLREQEVYSWTRKLPGSKIDNFTASLMLNNASFIGRDSIFYDSITNPRTEYGGRNQSSNLFFSVHEKDLSKAKIVDYFVYWHGYTVILKPLLMFFNITEIRHINGIVQLILLLGALYLVYKRLGIRFVLAFLGAIFFINPVSMAMSLQFSSVYYIMLLSIIFLFWLKNPDWRLFLWIGIFTAFLDLLTAPLLTLAIPLVFYCSLNHGGVRDDFRNFTKANLAWGIGYSLMWLLKWVIVCIFTEKKIVKFVIDCIIYRMRGEGYGETSIKSFDYLTVLKENFSELNFEVSYFAILFILLLILISNFKKNIVFKKDYRMLFLVIISLYPFVWYFIFINHSIVHPLLTYRELVITIFAILSCFGLMFQTKR